MRRGGAPTVEERGPSARSIFGRLLGEEGDVVLVVEQGEAMGTVRTTSGLYRIEPLGRGLYAVVRVDESAFPPDDDESQMIIDEPRRLPGAAASPAGPSHLGAPATTLNYKVLVAYTPAAAAAAGNIGLLINTAISETNSAYSNSGITPRVQLAHSVQVSYTESGSHDTDLTRFRGTADGYMDNVHALRNQYRADVMVLLINNTSLCGLASAIPATATTAFATVHYDCATGNYSFGHEIGHLQGARHDNDSGGPSYAHGYYYSPGAWRTIMAVLRTGVTRIQRFSTPNRTWNGVPTGTSASNDNVRRINETASTVANFRLDPVTAFLTRSANLATVTAHPSGGTGSYTYQWYRMPICGGGGGGGEPLPAAAPPDDSGLAPGDREPPRTAPPGGLERVDAADVACGVWHGPFTSSPPNVWSPYQGWNQNVKCVITSGGESYTAFSYLN